MVVLVGVEVSYERGTPVYPFPGAKRPRETHKLLRSVIAKEDSVILEEDII